MTASAQNTIEKNTHTEEKSSQRMHAQPISPPNATATTATIVATLLLVFYRYLIGLQPHSGQNNHHGAIQAFGGDYEAQRHWMELTLHLPLQEWYYHDLDYWGLDYPPLTAYVSYVCGYLSNMMVGPETVALYTSRGYEEETRHKPFMRATVLTLDVLLYFTAVYVCSRQLQQPQQQSLNNLPLFVFALSQPALVLVDHGHFQYNTTALGLALWSFYFITLPQTRNVVLGAIAFSMALSFKQMTLYYAPVVGCYLLGRCYARPQRFLRSFLLLGITVLSTFLVLWGPIVFSAQDPLAALKQILIRIFPVQRGLFEGKVANVWCALSIRPFSIRQRLSAVQQFRASLGLTVFLMTPACVQVFCLGKQYPIGLKSTTHDQQQQQSRALLWATSACALAFFLASFQVHEKSLLLAVAPMSLLWTDTPVLVEFFSFVSMWTLWPLLVIDRLRTAYVASGIIFVSALQLYAGLKPPLSTRIASSPIALWFRRLAYVLMLLLHVMELVIVPPAQWPDLFPVLWSVLGCALIGMAYVWTMYHFSSLFLSSNEYSNSKSFKDKVV